MRCILNTFGVCSLLKADNGSVMASFVFEAFVGDILSLFCGIFEKFSIVLIRIIRAHLLLFSKS